ncbi:hypothetical protein CS0771_25330 [Catellatospora sp. IY07-71]|nr:hypothetical protein CS0771_25330 [Catellatospora sp. IY07-71]
MIFSRKRAATGRHAKAEEPRFEDARAARRAALLGEDHEPEERPQTPAAGANGSARPLGSIFGDDGPYDFEEAPDAPRLDLGSLLLPAVEGVEIRVQAGEQGTIQQIALVHGHNALQLGAFAAPRSEGIWDEVREEIRKSLFADGVGAQEVPGRWGTELRARLRTPEGFNDLRFIGVDGPRWMVRAVFQGPAAVDLTEAGPLEQILTGLAVRRDESARPVREALPLRLPPDMAQRAAAERAAVEAAAQEPAEQPSAPQAHGGEQYGQNQLVPGRVPPTPAPTPFGTMAPTGAAGSGVPASGDAPRRKPSPRPRRD